MNVVYADHRAQVEEDLAGSRAHPFGGLLLSTGEAAGYDDPALEIEPTDDVWAAAHEAVWQPGATTRCASCGRRRGRAKL